MDYCSYCGAKMPETADSCPVCGRFRRQVQLNGGAPTVREPQWDEKTRVFDQRAASQASENRIRQAEQADRERQARRAEIERQPRYLHNDDPHTQPETLYDPQWNNEDYWQEFTDRPYPTQRNADGERQPRAAARNAGSYGRERQREEARGGQRPYAGQSGGRQPRPRQNPNPGGANRQRQGSGRPPQRQSSRQKPRSAVQQLQSDVGPAMREVRSRLRHAADGVVTGIRNPRSRQRRVLSVAGIAAASLIVLLLIVKLFTGGGEKAVLKKLARAYESQKPEAVESLSSDLMKALYPGDQLTADCRNCVGTVKDYFSERLGSSYRMSSKIEITENYTGAALSQQMESTFGVFGESYDMSRVKEMTKATLTLKAKRGHTAEKRIQVILVKEDGKWRLASQNL